MKACMTKIETVIMKIRRVNQIFEEQVSNRTEEQKIKALPVQL